MVPCIGVRLAVTMAAYCSPSGWSRDGPENRGKYKTLGHLTLGHMLQESPFSSWLGPLPHGDMVFQTWPTMAKTARIGRNGSDSRSHISMLVASNNLTKSAIDTWNLGPEIYPMSTLEVASIFFVPQQKNGTRKMAIGNIPHIGRPWLSHPKERIEGETPSSSSRFMSPSQIAVNLEQLAHTTPGRTLRGRWGFVPLWPKRGLVVPKVFTPKNVSPIPNRDGL